VGRHAEGKHGLEDAGEVLTYSRARGLFAGVSLNGAVIKQDKDSTRDFYGRMVPFKTALTGEIEPPAGANAFLTSLAQWRRRRRNKEASQTREYCVARARHTARLRSDSSLRKERLLGMTIHFSLFANNF